MTQGEKVLWTVTAIVIILIIGVFIFLFATDRIETGIVRNNDIISLDEKTYKKIKIADEMDHREKALDLISDFLVDYPASDYRDKVLIIAADIQYKNANYEGARDYVSRVLVQQDIANEDYVQAVIVLGKILKDNEVHDPVILNYLEDAYLMAGNEYSCKLALYLGYAYLYQGNFQTAISYFNMASGADTHIGKARLYCLQEMYAEAIQEYEQFLTYYPANNRYDTIKQKYMKSIYDYANSLKEDEAYNLAIEYYLKIVNRFPNSDYADASLFEIADAYYDNMDYGNAQSFLEKVLDNSNDYADDSALFSLGVLYYELDKKADAYDTFRELIESYPDSGYLSQATEWSDLISLEFQYQ